MADLLAGLERAYRLDPANPERWRQWIEGLIRARGPALLEPLSDRERWNLISGGEQDAAIELVRQLLGPDFEVLGTKIYPSVGQENQLELFETPPPRVGDNDQLAFSFEEGGKPFWSHRIACLRHRPTAMLLHLIPGGRSLMGTGPSGSRYDSRVLSPGELETETPSHPVRVRPFLIGRCPITQRQWGESTQDARAFIGGSLPIDGVSWHDARAWLTELGPFFRLPSEAEWEYAARAGAASRYFWGGRLDDNLCWHRRNSRRRTHSVHAHDGLGNAFGLTDISGLVWEWCEDDWIDSYSDGPDDETPRRAPGEPHRVIRGGSWNDGPGALRSASRRGAPASLRADTIGFRAAVSLPPVS